MKVKVHLDSANAILAKRKLGKGGQAQRFMVAEVRRVTNPYVPFSHILKLVILTSWQELDLKN